MQTWVALLRGVNVGGSNKVPMSDLRAVATGLGWTDVQSYIASGNLVFRAGEDDHATRLTSALFRKFGVDLPVLVVSATAFADQVATCPVLDGPGNLVHGVLCWDQPIIDAAAYQRLKAPDETLSSSGRIVWLHAPSGFSRSALANRLETVVTGTTFTVRNRNTLEKLVDISAAAV